MTTQELNIVVIDGHTINPGDLSWDRLASFGHLRVYDQSTPHEAMVRLKEADVAFVNKVIFDRKLIDSLPRLKFISLTATGYNNLDVEYLEQKGVLVSNVKGYGDYAVAQHSMALLLELTNLVGYYNQRSRDGSWANSGHFSFFDRPMTELFGKKIGIVGWGNIGSKTGAMAHAFGMEVMFFSKKIKKVSFARQVDHPDMLFKECDVISLHCLLTPDTNRLVNKRTLSMMKKEAFLINTSRGGLIDEEALFHALKSNAIAGAALDVLTIEPPSKSHPLFGLENCIITPHNAWSPKSVRQRLLDMAIDNLEAYLCGKPKNLIF